jgi:hypothetical protein
VSAPEWMRHGDCLGRAAGLPWTTDEADLPEVVADMIREACAQCPVRLACMAYADRRNMVGGWWAGQDRDPESPSNLARWEAVDWVPVKGRGGRVLGEQGALPLNVLGGVA